MSASHTTHALSGSFVQMATPEILRDPLSILDSSPLDYSPSSQSLDDAGGALANLLEAVRQRDDTLNRLSQLENEVDVLRRRDRALSHHMARLDEEQRLAARLQQDFLPKTLPIVGKLTFQTLFKPASYVSGDLYDVSRLDEHHVGLYIADAVGHGMPAALLTMFMKNALVTKEIGKGWYRLLEPIETISRLNDSLREQNLAASTFATAVYARIDSRTLQATIASGGHPAPVILSREGTIREIPGEGPLLGIFDDEIFTQQTVQLEPGDRLFLHSDGLELTFQTQGDAHIDAERWKNELVSRAQLPTADILRDIAAANPGTDDLTVLVVEVG